MLTPMWTAIFGYHQPLLVALANRFICLLTFAPWVVLLEYAAGASPRRIRVARTILLTLLLDRLMVDPVFWTPVLVILAAGWAAWRSAARAGLVTRRVTVLWLLGGLGLAALSAYGARLELLRYASLLFVLVGLYQREVAAAAAATASPTTEGSPWGRRAAVYIVAAGVLHLWLIGLTLQTFIPLLVLGIAGWTGLRFASWLRRRERGVGPARGHRISGLVGGLVTGLLLTLLLGEVYCRYIYDASDSNGNLRTSIRWASRHVVKNSWGYRDREFPNPAALADAPRVLVLGDSFAFGWGIDDDADRLGPQLEQELRRAALPDVRVFTMAIGGINTRRQIEIFRQDGTRLQPHVVVIAYHINDIDGPRFRVPQPGRAFTMWNSLVDSSDFMEFFLWRVFAYTAFKPGPEGNSSIRDYHDDATFAAHRENVLHLIGLIREAGAVPVVTLFPFIDLPTQSGPQRFAIDRITGVFESAGVAVLDVSQVVPVSERKYHANPFDPHPSPLLHRELVPHLAPIVKAALPKPVTSAPST